MHEAAAVVTFLSPGLRFLHQGQLEGRRKRISPHLVRAPIEPADERLELFYDTLISVLSDPAFQNGEWRLCECLPAWTGNWTSDCFIVSIWTGPDGAIRLVAVNYAPNQSQCYVRFPDPAFTGMVRLRDLMGSATYERVGNELNGRGLYLDLPAWGYHAFDVAQASAMAGR